MPRISEDLRYGLRMLLKAPGANATVFLAFSLGVGLSTLVFSMINGAVLPTLPVEAGDRIVRIERVEQPARTADDYGAWVNGQRSFDQLGAVESATVTLAVEGTGAEPVSAAAITPSVLELLAESPAIGRPFTDADASPAAAPVVLISHDVWRNRMGSDPQVVGRVIRVDGRAAEVAGVMAEGFGFPWDQDVWMPLNPDPVQRGSAVLSGSQEQVSVVGRLREGVSLRAASEEMTALTRELDEELVGASGPGSAVRVSSYTDLFSESGQSAALAILMLGVALLVLLVAASNAANVLLAQAMVRRREVAIRLAMGASRPRIMRQHLTEASLLAVGGAAGGIAIAVTASRYAEGAMPPGMPYWVDFGIDWRVLGFVAIVAVLAALMAGVIAAVQASRSNMHTLLKDDSRGSSSFSLGRLMRRLITVEIALSVLLLVLAGLFVRSGAKFNATEFAFAPEEVYTASIHLPETNYSDPATQVRFAEQVRSELEGLPETAMVAVATAVPGIGGSPVVPVEIEGRSDGGPVQTRSRSIVVSPGYFDLFLAPLSRGRDFDSRDVAGAPGVAIVNEAFERAYFPGGALNQTIRPANAGGEEWLTIVGVSSDLMVGGVEGEQPEAMYFPIAQHPHSSLRLLARPRGGFVTLTSPIRASLASIDPDVALDGILPLDRVIAQANSQYTWFSALFLVSGGVALFLAAIGLYGVMAFWVGQRTREIGVRIAIGGQRRDIVSLVLRQGAIQTSFGLITGVLLALGAAQLLRSTLFGVAPYDPLVYGSVLLVLMGAGWLGCWLPTLRATRIHPMQALVE